MMKQKVIDFINSNKFKNKFGIPFVIFDGELKKYKTDKLPNTCGIYITHSDKLGIIYIGMTESSANSRFERHMGRADKGKDYDKNKPHKVWDYFHSWCKTERYSLEQDSDYIFVSFQNKITKKQLEFLESGLIFEFQTLLNDDCFEWFGFQQLENLKGTLSTSRDTTDLFEGL